MVRRHRAVGLTPAWLAFVLATGAQTALAQTLPRLHVAALTLRCDTRSPKIGQPFHLVIAGRLQERLSSVDFVVLPNLAELEPLGDERHVIVTARGTDFSETLTVAARHAGRVHVAGAYLDAIDPRDGKPKRYYSNDLTFTVAGAAPQTQTGLGSLISFLAKLVGALLVLFVLAKLLRRKRVPAPAVVAKSTPESVGPAASPLDGLPQALADLRRDRDREAVMRLRFQLWKTAGAKGGETVGDLLARNGARGSLKDALLKTERAAFVDETQLADAVDRTIVALERHLA